MSETLVEMAKRFCTGIRGTCPSHIADNCGSCLIRSIVWRNDVNKQIKELQDWAAANPPKTYKDVLLEKFPKAMIKPNGDPYACRKHLFGSPLNCGNGTGSNCGYGTGIENHSCWNAPYEENTNA